MNPARYDRSVGVKTLQSPAGQTVWEEEFRSRYLEVLSGEVAVVSRRLKAFTDDIRGAGERTAFAAELLCGGEVNETIVLVNIYRSYDWRIDRQINWA